MKECYKLWTTLASTESVSDRKRVEKSYWNYEGSIFEISVWPGQSDNINGIKLLRYDTMKNLEGCTTSQINSANGIDWNR